MQRYCVIFVFFSCSWEKENWKVTTTPAERVSMLICGSEHTLKQLSDTRPSRSAFGVKEAIPHFTWSPWVFCVCVFFTAHRIKNISCSLRLWINSWCVYTHSFSRYLNIYSTVQTLTVWQKLSWGQVFWKVNKALTCKWGLRGKGRLQRWDGGGAEVLTEDSEHLPCSGETVWAGGVADASCVDRVGAGREVVEKTAEARPGLSSRMRCFILNTEKPLSDF